MIIAFLWVSLAVYLHMKADIHYVKVQDDLPVVMMGKEGGL